MLRWYTAVIFVVQLTFRFFKVIFLTPTLSALMITLSFLLDKFLNASLSLLFGFKWCYVDLNTLVILISIFAGSLNVSIIQWFLSGAIFSLVSGQLPPPRKIAPHLGLGVRSRLGLVLGLGGNQKIAPEKNWLLVRVRVWVRVSFKVGRQFPFGAIVLEPFSFCFFKSDILFSPSVCFIHCIFALCF